MKRIFVLLLVVGMSFSLMGCDACKENALNKAGDWVATLGKDGVEKDKVLAGRKADRAKKCAEQKAGEMKKKLGM
ncbi:MAG: hypothetical protein JW893_00950 [Candidatus Omnitrophica bacterium]|nr:hypothetical protein [Candidatus Omnitrophota bacterium]